MRSGSSPLFQPTNCNGPTPLRRLRALRIRHSDERGPRPSHRNERSRVEVRPPQRQNRSRPHARLSLPRASGCPPKGRPSLGRAPPWSTLDLPNEDLARHLTTKGVVNRAQVLSARRTTGEKVNTHPDIRGHTQHHRLRARVFGKCRA